MGKPFEFPGRFEYELLPARDADEVIKRVTRYVGGVLLVGLAVLWLLHPGHWNDGNKTGSEEAMPAVVPPPDEAEVAGNKRVARAEGLPDQSPSEAKGAQGEHDRERVEREGPYRGTVLSGVGPVEILDTRVEPGPNGSRQQVSLVKSSRAKHALLRVVQTERASPPQISVADHVLVQFAEGVTEQQVAQLIQQEELEIDRRFQHPGLYVIGGFEAGLDAVPDAITRLEALGADVQTVEPDYLHFPLNSGYDQAWDTNSNLVSDLIRPEESLHEKRGRAAMMSGDLVVPQLSATRTLTFDAPTFLGGVGSYAPFVTEQNMRVRNDSHGSYVQYPDDEDWPDNGTNYLRKGHTTANTVLHHSENLTFTLHQLDVAEYSTVTTANSIQLIGTRPDSSTVTQTLTLDRVMDGDGPLEDWQTFVLGPEFEHVVSVELNATGGFSLDNIQVTVQGQETPAPPRPADPLYYDITFSEPFHTIDETMAISGYFAPKSINFGNPIVRSAVGAMNDQPVELRVGDGGFYSSGNYEQFRIGMGQAASEYRMELDVMVAALGPNIYGDSFAIHWDGNGTQRLDFEEEGKIRIFQSGGQWRRTRGQLQPGPGLPPAL